MMNIKLYELISNLIDTGREDDWWDFKEKYHEDNASLLHDIICLANNKANKDSYLIFGIEDKTKKVLGIEEDCNRKSQQQIIDFLSKVKFAGQLRPKIELRTIEFEKHNLDILIIKNSNDVPYYLVEDYQKNGVNGRPGKRVRAYHIYTRVGDTNTPIDKSADLRDVEYLWKKHLGLIQTPLEQANMFLKKYNEWTEEDYRYYHKQFPQFVISIEEDDTEHSKDKSFYHYLQTDATAYYGMFKIFHYGTQLFSCPITYLDGYRMTVPCANWGFIDFDQEEKINIAFKFYLKNSMEYNILNFLEEKCEANKFGDAYMALKSFLEVVLVFDDEDECNQFKNYVKNNLDIFNRLKKDDKNEYLSCDSEIDKSKIINSKALQKMLIQFRKNEHL